MQTKGKTNNTHFPRKTLIYISLTEKHVLYVSGDHKVINNDL